MVAELIAFLPAAKGADGGRAEGTRETDGTRWRRQSAQKTDSAATVQMGLCLLGSRAAGLLVDAHHIALGIPHIDGHYIPCRLGDPVARCVVGIGNSTAALSNTGNLPVYRPIDIGET